MGARPHPNPDIRYDKTTAANAGTVARDSRTPRKNPGRGQPAIIDIRIARLETVTMTDTEYSDAVETLDALIARYERNHPDNQAPSDTAT